MIKKIELNSFDKRKKKLIWSYLKVRSRRVNINTKINSSNSKLGPVFLQEFSSHNFAYDIPLTVGYKTSEILVTEPEYLSELVVSRFKKQLYETKHMM